MSPRTLTICSHIHARSFSISNLAITCTPDVALFCHASDRLTVPEVIGATASDTLETVLHSHTRHAPEVRYCATHPTLAVTLHAHPCTSLRFGDSRFSLYHTSEFAVDRGARLALDCGSCRDATTVGVSQGRFRRVAVHAFGVRPRQ